jgi:tetratricopeptide (TPR) repeat protein
VHTAQPIGPPLIHSSTAPGVAFGADDATVVTGGGDGTVRVWDLGAAPKWKWMSGARESNDPKSPVPAETLGRLMSGGPESNDPKWGIEDSSKSSRDGKRIVTVDGTRARVCDAQTGKPLSPFMDAPHGLHTAVFGPDERSVVGASEDGTVRIWDARTAEPLIPPLQHGNWVGVGPMRQRAMLLEGGRLLFTFYTEARYWELPADSRTLEQWEQIAQLLSSRRRDANDGLEPLDRTSLSNLWSTLRLQATGDFAASAARRYDWNLWRAELCMAELNPAGALPHLNQLVAAEPERIRFRWLRSRAYEGLQRWREMAEDLRVWLSLAPEDRGPWTHLAAAELASGNRAAFTSACDAVAKRLGTEADVDDVGWTVRVCSYGTNTAATLALLRKRLERFATDVEASFKAGDTDKAWNYHRSLGALAFREGRFEEALLSLSKAIEIKDEAYSLRCFLAMSHQALGNSKEAKTWLERARPHEDPRHASPHLALTHEIPANFGLLRILFEEAAATVE